MRLSHLSKYAVDSLKIDRSFVKGLSEAQESQHIVRTVIGLAGLLGIQVIAEGVETQEQRELLLGLGCGYVQGYHLSRPLPASQATALIEEREIG